MASIHKRGAKYLVRWRDPDGTERTRSCPNRATADELRREVESAHALGRRWEPSAAAVALSLTDAAKLYLEHRAARKAGRTLENDDQAIAQFKAWLADKHPRQRRFSVEHITMTALSEFDAELRQRFSVRTANARTLGVRRWWAWLAARPECQGFLSHPPEARVLDLPAPVWAPPHAPSWAEMDAAIAAAETAWVQDLATVLRYTGLRQGQAMRLLWSDLDLDAGLLTIRPELGKTRQEKAGRTIPMSPHLLAWLAGRGEREGLLLAPHKVQRKASCREMDAIWEAGKVKESVWKGHPAHAFRYGFTSGLAQLGAEREAVEHLTGHAVQGARAHYLDPRWALALKEAVDLVPAIGKSKVKRLRSRSR